MRHPGIPVILFLIALVLAAGCAAPSESPFRGLTPAQARELAAKIDQARAQELEQDLRNAFAKRSPHNILILSGGDQDGAFGSGILHGWRRAPGGRPVFDVVTGVSTGALMGTFAFLGEERDDATLRDVYTHVGAGDVYQIFAPGSFDAVFDTTPLKRLIARIVTSEVIDRVAAAHREGRRLYVATFDLDANQVVIWPLSKIAAEGGKNRDQRYRDVLLASASVPVLFPPVRIEGDLHVDAGLREVVFLRSAMLGIEDAAGPDDLAAPRTVYAILNGPLRSSPKATPDGLSSVGFRSLELYQESQQLFNLREAAHVAYAHHPRFAFKYLVEPNGLGDPDESLISIGFHPQHMNKLYWIADAMGAHGRGWKEGLPSLDADPPVTIKTATGK